MNTNQFRHALASFLPVHSLEQLAAETQTIQRQRKFNISTFCWSLLLGFASQTQRQLTGFRRLYNLIAPYSLSKSAFNKRFSPCLKAFFIALFQQLLHTAHPQDQRYKGLMACFQEILAIDSTITTLAQTLAHHFPGAASSAALKLNAVYSAKLNLLKRVELTAGSTAEKKLLKAGNWLKDALLLLDKGYYCFDSLAKVQEQGAFFIIPLKRNANPDVTFVSGWDEFDEPVGFQTVQGCFSGEPFDGLANCERHSFRIVGLWNAETDDYHWYLTNLPSEQFTALEIGVLYRLRWAVELLFKQFKSGHSLDELPKARPEVIEILVYAALCSWLVSQHLGKQLKSPMTARVLWSKLFRLVAPLLMTMWVAADVLAARLEKMLKAEMRPLKSKRKSLVEQVDDGLLKFKGGI